MTKHYKLLLFFIATVLIGFSSCNNDNEIDDDDDRQRDNNRTEEYTEVDGEYKAILTDPPFVPKRPDNNASQKVIIDLEVLEMEGEINDGSKYMFWTFGGTVPGSFIRVFKNDLIEFRLNNHPNNKVPHNIDLHAVTGPGGGAEASMTAPGHSTTFSFRAINPGLYVYHCATAPVGMHIGNGMYGLILVEDRDNLLPEVDKEFYIMQGEFYTQEDYGYEGLHSFDMQEAQDENPDYVVFNGAVGAQAGDNSLQVEVGETVRIYVGNGGPNLISSFHVIGEIFDRVHVEGGDLINENVQTTLIPAGGSAIVEFKCEVPGVLNIVDHSVFRAFNKGAIAQISVNGEENEEIYTGRQRDEVYLLEGSDLQTVYPADKEEDGDKTEKSYADRIAAGKSLYMQNCASCHLANGEGIKGAFPPLAKSDYLMKLEDKGVNIVVHGLTGTITVNGVVYNSAMPALGLDDDKVASILTYVRNSWGNDGGEVTIADVKKYKKKK